MKDTDDAIENILEKTNTYKQYYKLSLGYTISIEYVTALIKLYTATYKMNYNNTMRFN